MAHFAKLDEAGIVLEVNVVDNAALDPTDEEGSGIAFLTEWSGGHPFWKQTSYNGTLRKNYAGAGFFFDESRDAFIPPKPFNSWLLNEESCHWEAPIPYPDDGLMYRWDEEQGDWTPIVFEA